MEHDTRRGRGQWRGVHVFDNIICEGDQCNQIKRQGALKQGEKYYYYYEVDGSTETHDPTQPTTNKCPFLPGQTVNTLEVPAERTLGNRSASMNSLRASAQKTLRPDDRFITPRPVPPIPMAPLIIESRVGSAHTKEVRPKHSAPCLQQKRNNCRSRSNSSRRPSGEHEVKEVKETREFFPLDGFRRKRSMSTRRLLGGLNHPKPSSRGSDSARTVSGHETVESRSSSFEVSRGRDATIRSTASSGSLRSRDMSPEALRRYLMDGLPNERPSSPALPKVQIPDYDADDVEDDDDNFATSAVSETMPFTTTLSPPPSQRSVVAPPFMGSKNSSSLTVTSASAMAGKKRDLKLDLQSVHATASSASSSAMNSPVSAPSITAPSLSAHSVASRDLNNHSFFDESDDDEVNSPTDEASFPLPTGNNKKHTTPFAGYSLPRPDVDNEKRRAQVHELAVSPARTTSDLLSPLPRIEVGLSDLSADMSWISEPRAI